MSRIVEFIALLPRTTAVAEGYLVKDVRQWVGREVRDAATDARES